MKLNKGLVIGLIIVFFGIAFVPSINANVSIISVEDERFVIDIEVCIIDETQKQRKQLSKQDAIELEALFDDMKYKLDNVNTKQETVEIFNDAVLSLNDFGLLPSDMSVEEAQQIVTNSNYDINSLKSEEKLDIKTKEDDYENFNCYIYGKTSWTTFFKPGWDIWFRNLRLLLILLNGSIAFGEECWDWNGGSGDYHKEPASGWIWTQGWNGTKKWAGESLWGNLGTHLYEYEFAGIRYKYLFYKGAIGFTGIRIRGFPTAKGDYFFGFASHVSIVREFPGKNLPIEMQNTHISQHSSLLFLRFLQHFPVLPILLTQ